MTERWRFKLFKLRVATILASLLVFHQSLSLCCSLNAEGIALLKFRDRVVRDPFGALSNWNVHEGDVDHCFWFGVECSDGKVISLKLKDLCLEGTLTPELGKLIYIKSIILRNNSFSRNIPVEVAELKELEVLDLGYNNFSEPFPSDIGSNLSLSILLLDNNENQLTSATVGASCNSRSSGWDPARGEDVAQRRLLQLLNPFTITKAKRKKFLPPLPSPSPSSSPSQVPSIVSPSHSPSSFPIPPPSKLLLPDFPSASPSHSFTPSPSPMPPPSAVPPALANLPIDSKPPAYHPSPLASPGSAPSQSEQQNSKSANNTVTMWFGVTGGSLVLLFSVVCVIFCRSSKMVTVGPWVTGLSGQLQKAFVTGVPKLQRSELVSACEDFSNIIGSLSDGTVYKGTLSSGVEIAVASTAVKSAEDWSKKLEGQFRKKIETLSKVSHKNFVNLIGFCEEGQPFTRMMVFEYTPNGTLFEHLHIMEAEHLEWTTRLRIAMGVAYCLEHMHQLNPPIAHANLHSSSIYLTEDYAAKISDFRFWNETTATIMGSIPTKLLETPASDRESNVYSFGIILFEIVTGKIPYSTGNDSLVDWVWYYLKGDRPIKEMVDPTLTSFQEDVLEKVFAVIKDCVHLEPRQRPTMKEVTRRLKEITAMGPDGATPKTSPLWWAELEILSSEVSS